MFCSALALLADANGLAAFRHAIDSRCLTVSALACHGNPLHPRSDVARAHHETFIRTVELAQRLGVDTVTLFSGCPGDSETATYPNWVTCAWPTEYGELLEWQWREKVIPYWRDQARFAQARGVRLAFENLRLIETDTRVAQLEDHAPFVLDVRPLQPELAAVGHRFNGVLDEVVED